MEGTASRQDPTPRTDWTQRTELLIGPKAMARLSTMRVILFGIGGVGSWCAEALIRTGVGHLTLVDFDRISPSNINRQLPALTTTVGQLKVEVLRDRLLTVNPRADIQALPRRYTPEEADTFDLGSYDYVVDAIDSLPDKADLIRRTCALPSTQLLSAMGAARKTDPTRVRMAEFSQVHSCPLAKALRRLFKTQGEGQPGPFRCVYSDEHPIPPNPDAPNINGSVMPVTAAFGLILASIVIQDTLTIERCSH